MSSVIEQQTPAKPKNETKRRRAQSLAIACVFIGLSILIRSIYVFKYTDYHHYLVSDMGGYWVRALEWMRGDHHSGNQWAIWPPLFHVVLAYVFIVLSHLGITGSHWLACILEIQIVLGGISVYCVYLIAEAILHNRKTALIVGMLYLLMFPVTYLNAFLLSENTGLPLMIIAVCILIRRPKSVPWMLISGLILGVAVGIRPAYVLFGAACFLFAAVSQGSARKSVKALAFGGTYATVIALVCIFTSWMSVGHIRGMSANGGLNFFIAQGKWLKVVMHYPLNGGTYTYIIVAPQFAEEQWRGTYETNEPPYNQSFFVRQGLKYLREPSTWADDFREVRKLYFGPLFPYLTTAAGMDALDPIFKPLVGWLTLISLILTPTVWIFRGRMDPIIALLWSFVGLVSTTSFFFGCERRYVYSVTFALFPVLFGLFFRRKNVETGKDSV